MLIPSHWCEVKWFTCFALNRHVRPLRVLSAVGRLIGQDPGEHQQAEPEHQVIVRVVEIVQHGVAFRLVDSNSVVIHRVDGLIVIGKLLVCEEIEACPAWIGLDIGVQSRILCQYHG